MDYELAELLAENTHDDCTYRANLAMTLILSVIRLILLGNWMGFLYI